MGGGEAATQDERISVNPIALGIALFGAVLMIVALFLPYVDSDARNNSLAQNQDWVLYLPLAVIIAIAGYRAYSAGTKTFAVIACGVLAIYWAIDYGHLDSENLTLYPTDDDGNVVEGSEGTEYDPGIGYYVAGIGGALAVIGGFLMRRDDQTVARVGASSGSHLDDLKRITELRDAGTLSQDEFAAEKARIMGSAPAPAQPKREARSPRTSATWECEDPFSGGSSRDDR